MEGRLRGSKLMFEQDVDCASAAPLLVGQRCQFKCFIEQGSLVSGRGLEEGKE